MPFWLMSADRALAFIRSVYRKCGVTSLYTCADATQQFGQREPGMRLMN